MANIEQLFLSTLSDLASRIRSADEYTVLGASALIRKLLIDSSPLVDQVNRHHALKIRFEISQSSPTVPGVPDPQFWSIQDGLDPETSRRGRRRVEVNRDQLLSTIVEVIEGRSYTLREIVLFEAHIMGGVHAGLPKADKENAQAMVNDNLSIGGRRASVRQLQAIGRVVLRGLEPLKVSVESALGV